MKPLVFAVILVGLCGPSLGEPRLPDVPLAESRAPFPVPAPRRPSIPERSVDIRDFGAKGDGVTLDTAAIQRAIDACATEGGGVVRVPPGIYLTGSIFLRNRIALHVDKGATLRGSTNLFDYPVTVPGYRSYADNYTDKSLIYGENLTDVGITGEGGYDGQGMRFKGDYKARPFGIRLVTCTNVLVEGVTLRNSPMWMQHYLACDNVTIRGVTVWNQSNHNNDGIDIDGCHNVLVTGCEVDSDDDALVLKSTSPRACENVTVSNCTLRSHCNGFKCGTESTGGFKNVAVSHCTILPSADPQAINGRDKGLGGVALEIVDGGTLDGVTVSNVTIRGYLAPLFVRLGNRARPHQADAPRPGVGVVRNVTLVDIAASDTTATGCAIAGITGHPVENVTLRNLHLEFPGGGREADRVRRFDEKAARYPESSMFAPRLPAYGLFLWHVRGLHTENIQLTTVKSDARPAVVREDVQGDPR